MIAIQPFRPIVARPSRSPFNAGVLVYAAVLLAPILGWAEEKESRSTWDALPDTTIFAARMPEGQAFLQALRQRTKLGAVLLSEQRMSDFMSLIESQNPEEWEEFTSDLEAFGLEPSDLPALLHGESGVALVMEQDDDLEPLAVGIGWIEPGQPLATKTFGAVGQAVEAAAAADNPHAPKRVDFVVEDCPVMYLRVPEMGYEPMAIPDDFDQWEDEQRRDFMNDWMNTPDAAQEQVLQGYVNVLVARMGGRLIAVTTFEPETEADAEKSVKRLTAMLARCLAAHRDQTPGFVSRMQATEGIGEALPQEGLGGFEVYGDLASLISLAADETPGAGPILEATGLDRVGAAGMRLVLDGTVLRTGAFLEAPAPRSGIVKIIEQEQIEAAPPAWVPRDLLSYTHISADLGAIYEQVKATVMAIQGPAAEGIFGMAESWAFGFAQADLNAILSAFGHKHMVIQFVQALEEEAGPSLGASGLIRQRVGVVWQVRDADLLRRLVEAGLTMLQGEGFVAVEEQGFAGWRFEEGPAVGGLMIGKTYMVLAMGDGVMETVLASLTALPAGETSLRGSTLFEEAKAMSDLQSGVVFQMTDGERSALAVNAVVMAAVAKYFSDMRLTYDDAENEDRTATLMEKIRVLLPTPDQWRGMIGVGTGWGRVTNRGIVFKGDTMLPAP